MIDQEHSHGKPVEIRLKDRVVAQLVKDVRYRCANENSDNRQQQEENEEHRVIVQNETGGYQAKPEDEYEEDDASIEKQRKTIVEIADGVLHERRHGVLISDARIELADEHIG